MQRINMTKWPVIEEIRAFTLQYLLCSCKHKWSNLKRVSVTPGTDSANAIVNMSFIWCKKIPIRLQLIKKTWQ